MNYFLTNHVDCCSLYFVFNIFTGFKLPYAFSRPHTIFMTNNDHWKEESRQCRALMYCFMYALNRAREKFGVSTHNTYTIKHALTVTLD
jgi:hypothetical protein